ncbi:hypothetical protein PAT3040_02805 [Paenibacillus agaridevorans]|uniref:Uncharacterized protein n=1 Tax=Paenibacillus agaridevorans TaxID=171404 RepID=A0A2R5EWQ5_9BACL|nr:hypothetical protein [Paenibacillus agaridevorans]GBG08233.1 hypothetical protein PAT3040_02805 [Paenibacillus agaridevorans]
MMINLNQISSNKSKVIEVEENEFLTAKIQMPLFSKYSSTTMTSNGELLYSTHFQLLNEIKNSIPLKWLWSEKVTEACIVKDRTDTIIGAVQHIRKEFILSYYGVNFKNENIKIYEVTKKSLVHLLIFYEDKQIGQIEKSLKRYKNLDQYQLFLLDDFSRFKDIIILFVGYFDNWNYSDIGEVVSLNREISWEWSYSKANSKYNKNWIQENFHLSEEHRAAINNEQMGIVFIIIFVLMGLMGIAVVIGFIVQK